MSVVTRFAPSPTGDLHVGGARTARYSWLLAKSKGGEFVLRSEDTDIERSTEEAKQAILDGMQWLGLTWDTGPIYQTERFDRYKELIQQLLDEGKAYAAKLSKAGVEVNYKVFPRMTHAFFQAPGLLDDARAASNEAGFHLRKAFN